MPNVSKVPHSARGPVKPLPLASVDVYVAPSQISPDDDPTEEFVPTSVDKPVGLDLDDFLPVSILFVYLLN